VRLELLVDGRVLDDDHPGVRRFWVPVLRAWASRGGRGAVAHAARRAPEAQLVEAGFTPVELRDGPRSALGLLRTRRVVRASGARASLSPLYLTLSGARVDVGTIYDLTGRTHARTPLSRFVFEAALFHTRRHASRVVTISEAAKAALEAAITGLRGRVDVVAPVAPAEPRPDPGLLARLSIARPYALAIASHRPHKRLAPLADAWLRAAPDLPLVVAGRGTEALAAPPLVYGLGFVDDASLEALLAGAACLVSASVAEGGGLPALAALAAGVPVVATRLPALEELAGESAVWVELDDHAGLVGAAARVARQADDTRRRVAAGRERARAFSADRAARELARLLD